MAIAGLTIAAPAAAAPNGPVRTGVVLNACEATTVIGAYGDDETFGGWDLTTETRLRGFSEVVDGGLHIWTTLDDTDEERDQSKSAGYLPLDIPLANAGEIEIVLEEVEGPEPSLQIGVDLDGNGSEDGYLVYEHVYNGNIWASSGITGNATLFAAAPQVGGGGSPANGTIQQWVAAFPSAQIKHVGYSLGSGVIGSAVITELKLGCNSYVFDETTPVTVQECAGPHAIVASYGDDPELGGWDFEDDTRANGSNVIVDGGVIVKTVPDPIDGTLGQSKATGYLDISKPLAEAGTDFGLELTNISGGQIPGLNIGVDMDNDGNQDGYLVYEPDAYGERVWASTPLINAFPGTAWPSDSAIPHRPAIGTVNQFLDLFPTARMTRVGYSLGSGAEGEVKITKVTLGCTDYTFDDAAPVIVQSCEGEFTELASYGDDHDGWDFTQTRSEGKNTWVNGGLFVETFPYAGPNPAQNKAAGYYPLDIPLYQAGEYGITLSNTTGALPSLQLGVDLDNDTVEDGYLVYESIYGGGLWASSTIENNPVLNAAGPHENVGGYAVSGSLQSFVDSFPTAQIKHIGYSLGSGVVGSALIEKLTVGCIEFTFDDHTPVFVQSCEGDFEAVQVDNLDTEWDFSQTRTRGENIFTPDGLFVETFVDDTGMSPNQSKAAGYLAVDFPLYQSGEYDIVLEDVTGTEPSLQIGVDLDDDGIEDGYLVYESIYGANIWASSGITGNATLFAAAPKVGGGGSGANGTLQQWVDAFPDAQVMHVGYSLGSGVVGSALITKLVLGCLEYSFTEVPYFIDVLEPHTFYNDVQWLARNAITTGYPEAGDLRSFHPAESVTREAMAAFLYRAAGSPAFADPVEPSFSDVPTNHFFFTEIEWLAAEGITTGNADGTFTPNAFITRQAMAVFLYRGAGSPAFPDPVTASFTDVPTNHFFFTEIEWLAAEGISTGNADGTFTPNAFITRQAMAVFLYRGAGSPAFPDPVTASFTDVPTNHFFFTEIEWLKSVGITTGNADGTFGAGDDVTRQAMAAFLHRASGDD